MPSPYNCRRSHHERLKLCPAAKRLRAKWAVDLYASGLCAREAAATVKFLCYRSVINYAKRAGVPIRKRGGRRCPA